MRARRPLRGTVPAIWAPTSEPGDAHRLVSVVEAARESTRRVFGVSNAFSMGKKACSLRSLSAEHLTDRLVADAERSRQYAQALRRTEGADRRFLVRRELASAGAIPRT
jgi:hypothetical protein